MTREKASEILLALQISFRTTAEQGLMPNTEEISVLSDALNLAIIRLLRDTWITIENGLPFDDRDQLVSTKGMEIYKAYWQAELEKWIDSSDRMHVIDDVTAWMPLPEPYEVPDE